MGKVRLGAAAALAIASVGAWGAGTAGQSDAAATPTSLTGTWTDWGFCAERVADGEISEGAGEGGPSRTFRGLTDASSWTASDDRLSGAVTTTSNVDEHTGDAATVFVTIQGIEVVNDDGSWTGATTMFLDPEVAASRPNPATDIFTLTGEGGYEGLVAVIQIVSEATNELPCDLPFSGVIIGGELPPIPE
jgi:hypothetical protein